MGKGDKKSKRGKITIGSYGVKRRKKKKGTGPISTTKASADTEIKEVKAPVVKKATKKASEPKEATETKEKETKVKEPKAKAAPKKTSTKKAPSKGEE